MGMTASAPLVSVIVPIYSGRDYFTEFLECLQSQTLREIEMIFIDDCGTDGAFELAQKAAETDSRIRLIRNSRNMGPGVSRNKGIAAAQGKYLAFADSDDIIPPDYYERLYHTAEEKAALVVKCGRANLYEDGTVVPSMLNANIKAALANGVHVVNAFEWEHTTAIYNREHALNNNARNSDSRQDEDTTFIMEVLHNVSERQFALIEDLYYYYRVHEQSVTRTLDYAYLVESIKSMNDKLDFILSQKSTPQLETYAARIIDNRANWRFRHARCSDAISYGQKEEYIRMILDSVARYRRHRPLHELFGPAMLLENGTLSIREYIDSVMLAKKSRFWLLFRYWCYMFKASITWGNAGRRYKAKRNSLKAELREMK